jgi:hypothetical protein
MTKVLHGKIHGRTIELSEDLGLAPGEEIEVLVKTLKAAGNLGDGLLRTEGALADDPYWDEIMQEIYQERKQDTRREDAE